MPRPVSSTSFGMLDTLIAGIQPDWARDVFGGVANATLQQGGAWWPAPPTPSGSPSPDLDQGMYMMNETYKPNGN